MNLMSILKIQTVKAQPMKKAAIIQAITVVLNEVIDKNIQIINSINRWSIRHWDIPQAECIITYYLLINQT